MKIRKLFVSLGLVILMFGCGNKTDTQKKFFSIEIEKKEGNFNPNDDISVSILNKKNRSIDSVIFSLNDTKAQTLIGTISTKVSLNEAKMGSQLIAATVFSEGETFDATKKIIVTASKKPEIYGYKILEKFPHNKKSFTQGLEFYNDTLYESTGQYGESTLRKLDYRTGEILKEVKLDNEYFAEGLTVVNDKIYQLTWREKKGFIYNANTLEKTGTFAYNESKEGWGLCNDGETIYKSDGSEKLWKLDLQTLKEKSHIEVYTNTKRIDTINELEWVNGRIYANIWQKDAIAIVNPENGAVEGVINLKGLKENVTNASEADVLNGIAYKGEPNILYITGKNWDTLFKVEILKK